MEAQYPEHVKKIIDLTLKIKNNIEITKNNEKLDLFRSEFYNNLLSFEAEMKLQIF